MDPDGYMDVPFYHPTRMPIPSNEPDIESQFNIQINPSPPDDRYDWLQGTSATSGRVQSQTSDWISLDENSELFSREMNENQIIRTNFSSISDKTINQLAEAAPTKSVEAGPCKMVKVNSRQFVNEPSREIEITTDLLSQHYHESLEAAAASIGIGKSTMKVVCRRLGVEKWPYVRSGSRKKRRGQKTASSDESV
uniref:RWP-RK domain-containing protein n=1 Tax=Hanusia phi TaxID=3032 RepID=A0A7S0EMP8_9CRYP|mmetsp:Transcript_27960/g.63249  ORF Transcript_27960/g.63249 Transcript_27960/m.63249 type:complete len:195 (+) Transcript_27960:209-793(+)